MLHFILTLSLLVTPSDCFQSIWQSKLWGIPPKPAPIANWIATQSPSLLRQWDASRKTNYSDTCNPCQGPAVLSTWRIADEAAGAIVSGKLAGGRYSRRFLDWSVAIWQTAGTWFELTRRTAIHFGENITDHIPIRVQFVFSGSIADVVQGPTANLGQRLVLDLNKKNDGLSTRQNDRHEMTPVARREILPEHWTDDENRQLISWNLQAIEIRPRYGMHYRWTPAARADTPQAASDAIEIEHKLPSWGSIQGHASKAMEPVLQIAVDYQRMWGDLMGQLAGFKFDLQFAPNSQDSTTENQQSPGPEWPPTVGGRFSESLGL